MPGAVKTWIYYITVIQRKLRACLGDAGRAAEEGILKGMYRLRAGAGEGGKPQAMSAGPLPHVNLLGSGCHPAGGDPRRLKLLEPKHWGVAPHRVERDQLREGVCVATAQECRPLEYACIRSPTPRRSYLEVTQVAKDAKGRVRGGLG